MDLIESTIRHNTRKKGVMCTLSADKYLPKSQNSKGLGYHRGFSLFFAGKITKKKALRFPLENLCKWVPSKGMGNKKSGEEYRKWRGERLIVGFSGGGPST